MASTELNNLRMWEAVNSGGEPVCIGDGSDEEGSLSLSLYSDGDGVLRGVEVWGVVEGEFSLVGIVGELPKVAVDELLNEPTESWYGAADVVDLYDEKYPDGEGLVV